MPAYGKRVHWPYYDECSGTGVDLASPNGTVILPCGPHCACPNIARPRAASPLYEKHSSRLQAKDVALAQYPRPSCPNCAVIRASFNPQHKAHDNECSHNDAPGLVCVNFSGSPIDPSPYETPHFVTYIESTYRC